MVTKRIYFFLRVAFFFVAFFAVFLTAFFALAFFFAIIEPPVMLIRFLRLRDFGSSNYSLFLTFAAFTTFKFYAIFFLYQGINQRFPLFWSPTNTSITSQLILSSIELKLPFLRETKKNAL